jgi:hypothetical protein
MAEDTREGTELAGYQIEGVIRRGGMNVVYLAEHVRLGCKLALKVLSPELAGSERFHDRFLRDGDPRAKIAMVIPHPWVTDYPKGGGWFPGPVRRLGHPVLALARRSQTGSTPEVGLRGHVGSRASMTASRRASNAGT